MPAKIRLHELAKELGMTNKETLDLSVALGIGVKSHSSSIEEAQADRVRRRAERDGLIRPEQPEEAKPAKAAADDEEGGRQGREPAAVAVAEPGFRPPVVEPAPVVTIPEPSAPVEPARAPEVVVPAATAPVEVPAAEHRVVRSRPLEPTSRSISRFRRRQPRSATGLRHGRHRARPRHRRLLRRDRQPRRSARPHPRLLSARLLPARLL